MTDLRDLPGIIERAIPMPPHATIAQGVAVERLRAVTEAQVREVIEAERAEALLAEVAEYRRRVSEVHEAATGLVGAAWDDGNGAGLDGWVGPGRGAGEVDAEAEHARTRFVHKADRKLDEVEAVGDE